ncbi:MAG: ROK family transcriptional regulator [Alphaproteobacteria bacterium]|nr:ROK family transcriptional regulator [Alphaproteobacteria bacterium]
MGLKGDQGTSRAMNRRLVLNLLRANGPLSRAEMAGITGLSPATLTFVVSDLLAENVLIEGKSTIGAAGRRPVPVEINYGSRLAVGLKLMVGSIDCVLTDLATTTLHATRIEVADQSPESMVAGCVDAVAYLSKFAPQGAQITGVGVAMPGIVQAGICHRSFRFGWSDVPIASMIAERLHVPVWVDDDINAFALAQQLFGLGRHHRTVGALAIGVGISCAAIIDGNVHHGAHGSAGKLGHITFDPQGPLCECGRAGCLQAMFSEPAMVEEWRTLTGNPGAVRQDLLAAAEVGDAAAIDLLGRAGAGIGQTLAAFCNIVDPELIVVGGEAVSFGDFLFDPMRRTLAKHCTWTPPKVEPHWADDSWARGAAALATQQLFDFEASDGAMRALPV